MHKPSGSAGTPAIDDLEKYVLEQAKIEVEHTRSWPTKILAFYGAVHAAVVTGVKTLNAGPSAKWAAALALSTLIPVSIALLWRNHHNYLRHRNLQIAFQRKYEHLLLERFGDDLPAAWLQPSDISIKKRWIGWAYYAWIMAMVSFLSLGGIVIS
jgi:hypothetical protein